MILTCRDPTENAQVQITHKLLLVAADPAFQIRAEEPVIQTLS